MRRIAIYVVVILVNYGNAQGQGGFVSGPATRDRGADGLRGVNEGFWAPDNPRGSNAGSGGQMGGGSSGPAPVRECPRERRISGFQCGRPGNDFIDCPTGSECITDPSTGTQICCWNDMSTISAPCEDPMMRGGQFVSCVPDELGRQSCPGSCHTCERLQNIGTGLCCPQTNVRGCERSSPMRNEFEASRRRIQGLGDSGSTSTSRDSVGTEPNRLVPEQSRNTMDPGPPPGESQITRQRDVAPRVDMDFGMTRSTGARMDLSRLRCPGGGGIPTGPCAPGYPCGGGQACIAVSRTSGVCCVIRRPSPVGLPGVRAPLAPGIMGRGMMMRGLRGLPFPPRGPSGFGGMRAPFIPRGPRPMF